ncbi:MAG: hypothetical protein AAB676_06360 [Verrucomicrobiota bacterium]
MKTTLRNTFFVLSVAGLLSTVGCTVPSLHPLYTEKDLVFDPALEGKWVEAGAEDEYMALSPVAKDDSTSEQTREEKPQLVDPPAPESQEHKAWSFELEGEKYKLTIPYKEGKDIVFEAHLLKLDNTLFLDLYPHQSILDSIGDNYYASLVPTHLFLKVRQIKPTLQLAALNDRWLDGFLAKHPRAIKHERINKVLVLTASTKELQRFVRRHSKTKGAFAKPF